MFNYFWPIVLIVVSNVFYNVITKSTPREANPFLSLTITYLAGMAAAFIVYLATSPHKQLVSEIQKLNWTSILLALAIVGLETGYIFVYRAGWNISGASLVANIALAIILVFVGALFYQEHITFKQIIGIALCLAGLFFINMK